MVFLNFGFKVGQFIVPTTLGYIESLSQREEMDFALGASLILGTDRLLEAEMKKTEWFEILLINVPALIESAVDIPNVNRAAAQVRTAGLLEKLETGGWKAFQELSKAQKASVLEYLCEAKRLEELGELEAMDAMHKRAAKLAGSLEGDIQAKSGLQQAKPGGERIRITKAEVEAGSAKPAAKPAPPIEWEFIDESTFKLPKGDEPIKQGKGVPDAHEPYSKWVTLGHDGKIRTFMLGKRLGQGVSATVYELVGSGIKGCEEGCVIKIVSLDGAQFGTGFDVVRNIESGEALLGDDIPHLKAIDYKTDARSPYLIQRRLGPDEEVLEGNIDLIDSKTGKPVIDEETKKPRRVVNPKMLATFQNNKEYRLAVIKLFRQLADKGLAWEDCHLGNIYFSRKGNQLVAGILDTDRIIKFSERNGRMGAWFDWVETEIALGSPGKLGVRSMHNVTGANYGDDVAKAMNHFVANPGPYWPDQEFFMQKMFEYKGWIFFDETTKEFKPFLLDPKEIQENGFPSLFDPVRSDSINKPKPDPFWKPSTMLIPPAVLPWEEIDVFAGNQKRSPVARWPSPPAYSRFARDGSLPIPTCVYGDASILLAAAA
jgi:hypothetical protein